MKRFLKFGTVGVFNTLITFVSFSMLVTIGLNYLIANIISYGLGVLNSYYWNKNWVFNSIEETKRVLWKFIVVNVITLLVNTVTLYILVDYLKFYPIIGQLFSICIGMVMNYFFNKTWTFNIRRKTIDE